MSSWHGRILPVDTIGIISWAQVVTKKKKSWLSFPLRDYQIIGCSLRDLDGFIPFTWVMIGRHGDDSGAGRRIGRGCLDFVILSRCFRERLQAASDVIAAAVRCRSEQR